MGNNLVEIVSEMCRDYSEYCLSGNYNIVLSEANIRGVFIDKFISALNFNLCDLRGVVREFDASIISKRGKKIDYALFHHKTLEKGPTLMIEAKKVGTDLSQCLDQIGEYFQAVVRNYKVCPVLIITDGVIYNFFADTEQSNILDSKPFYTLDVNNMLSFEYSLLNSLCLSDSVNFSISNFINSAKKVSEEKEWLNIVLEGLQKYKKYNGSIYDLDNLFSNLSGVLRVNNVEIDFDYVDISSLSSNEIGNFVGNIPISVKFGELEKPLSSWRDLLRETVTWGISKLGAETLYTLSKNMISSDEDSHVKSLFLGKSKEEVPVKVDVINFGDLYFSVNFRASAIIHRIQHIQKLVGEPIYLKYKVGGM